MALSQASKDKIIEQRELHLKKGWYNEACEFSKLLEEKIPKTRLIELGEFYFNEGWIMVACQAFRDAALFEK